MPAFQKLAVSLGVALALAAFATARAEAQAPAATVQSIPVAQAEAFLGNWVMDVQGTALELNIKNQEGQVAADIVVMGTTSRITTIARDGEALRLRWVADFQGQQAPVSIKLTPNGANLDAAIDVADGTFAATGSATKK